MKTVANANVHDGTLHVAFGIIHVEYTCMTDIRVGTNEGGRVIMRVGWLDGTSTWILKRRPPHLVDLDSSCVRRGGGVPAGNLASLFGRMLPMDRCMIFCRVCDL